VAAPFWLSWLLLGLIAGVLAQLLYPQRILRGLLLTLALGVVGSMAGGWLGLLLMAGSAQPLTDTVGHCSILTAVMGANLVILGSGWPRRS
jgi:uncharacterized membrane protein YeaQ/YmgE (transglycosylase-associated protein family)